jgi:flagella basal body P-ring formation protein FlgA
MRKPQSLEGVVKNAGDRQALRNEGVDSVDAAWSALGAWGDKGRRLFRDDPNRRQRLVRDLTQAASGEAVTRDKSVLGRYWLDLLLALSLILFLVLLGRAFWPSQGKSSSRAGSVAIALRSLKAGELLRPEALHGSGGLELPKGRRPGPALRLIADVPEGGYIFPENLERYEVIALRDIPEGSAIPSGAVRQEWKPYRKKPAALLEQIVGNRASQQIPRGATVRLSQIESESVLVDQIVASQTLPRFHRVTAADVHVERRSRQPGALLRSLEAVGRYPLEEIEAGSTLTSKNLSSGVLDPADLAGRQLLTLRVQPPSFRMVARLPARISLAVSVSKGLQSLLLRNVPVLAVDSGSNGPTVVVALGEQEIQQLLPLLPDAQIYLLQPPS